MDGKRALEGLDQEIGDHIDRDTQQNIDRGMTPEEARRLAMLKFGSVIRAQEDAQNVWSWRWLDDLRQDVRYGFRNLYLKPGFTAIVVITLALGLGANTAIFSLVETVLLRWLPVNQPQELVFLQPAGKSGSTGVAPPYPLFERIREQSKSFTDMAGFAADELKIEVNGVVEQVFGQAASGSYFEVVGLRPAAGRLLTKDDEKLDPPVAVIGHGYWQKRFAGAPSAIGQTLSFGGRVFTIVGVTPANFWGLHPGRQIDVTIPITVSGGMVRNPRARWFDVLARLRPGVTVQQATTEINTVVQSIMSSLGGPARLQPERFELAPAGRGLDQLRARFAPPLYALMTVAVLLLIIACANLGGLLLVRGAARSREFAVRLAMGAGRARLVRQLLTETLLLFLLGAAASLVVAYVAVQRLAGFFSVGRRPILLDVHFDWVLMGYALAVTLVAGVLTGLWPAVRALRTDPQAAINENEGRLTGATRRLTGRIVVVSQVALSLVLLVSAALFVTTIVNLRAVDLGFKGTGVLTMSVQPDLPRDTPDEARAQVWKRVLDHVRGMPGVQSASLSVLTPLSGRSTGNAITVPGFSPADGEDQPAYLNHVSEDYFRTFGVKLVAGRVFTAADTAEGLKVAVLNETAAKTYFPGRSALDATIVVDRSFMYRVVGVVGDYKHVNVREDSPRFAFVPVAQPAEPLSRLTLAVSSGLSPSVQARQVPDAIRAMYPSALVSDLITVDDQIDETLIRERLLSTLASGFAGLALVLAAIGLYGTLSHSVAARRTEFGLRMALGEQRSSVLARVVREALLQAAIGIVIGVPLALMAARAAERLLFGISAANPMSYVVGAVALAMVACAAGWLPARRACSLDPAETLRQG